MDTEPPHLALGVASLAGAAVWGTYTLVMAFFAAEPIRGRDAARALVNVAAAIVVGLLVAYFLGPAILSAVPVATLKDPHVVGFALGAGAWEVWPFAVRFARGKVSRFVKEKR